MPLQLRNMNATLFWCVIFALSLLLFFVYQSGVEAGFVLDDYGPLRPLAFWGGIDTLGEVLDFLRTGFSVGPAGRPVAMLSFLLQAGSWPNSSAPFLIFNIAIHVLSAGAVAGFLRALFRASEIQQADRIALFAAIFWALHPWHVSTVLYTVQRMTSLAMLFSILAMWAYLPLRAALQQQRFWPSFVWSMVLGFSSLMALGCKESAVLIPQFLLLMEWLLGRQTDGRFQPHRSKWLRAWLLLFAFLPCLYVWFYLVHLGLFPYGYGHRDFSVGERLVTEIGVVGLYLQSLVLPKIITPGLFYDGYPVVRDFLSSPTTVFWAFAHLIILASALISKRRWPLFLFSTLWFYGGHLLESTTVPLELVFEHRNYMPSLGVLILLSMAVSHLCERYKFGRWVVAITFLLLATLLYQRVAFWSNPIERAIAWAEILPDSARAQENAFLVLFKSNKIEAGNYYMDRSIRLAPEDPYLKLKRLSNNCKFYGQVGPIDWAGLNRQLSIAKMDFGLYRLMSGLLQYASAESCEGLAVSQIDDMISAAMMNEQIKRSSIAGNLNLLRGEIYILHGNVASAISEFKEARARMRDKSVAIYQARMLASNQYFAPAVAILDELLASDSIDSFLRKQAMEVRNKIEEDTMKQ